MKLAVSLLCCLAALMLPADNPKSAAKRKPSTAQLLEVGEFHGDEVQAKTGEQWLGLFFINGEHVLLPVTLTVKGVRDDLVDGKDESTGKKVSINHDQEPVFLVKGVRLIPHRLLPTIFSGKKFLYNEPLVRLTFGGRDYELNATAHKEEEAKKGAALTISSGSETQMLHFVPDAMEIPENMSLMWVGDLDEDGKLDLYVDISEHYNVSRRVLFLSSLAGKGKMLRKAAEFRTTGC